MIVITNIGSEVAVGLGWIVALNELPAIKIIGRVGVAEWASYRLSAEYQLSSRCRHRIEPYCKYFRCYGECFHDKSLKFVLIAQIIRYELLLRSRLQKKRRTSIFARQKFKGQMDCRCTTQAADCY